ncbi:MAG: amidophosphoribosyltransferase [Thermoplasmata archaeon]|nr:amidophosphoribosyltransferase [Thermoplasmata archaeon]
MDFPHPEYAIIPGQRKNDHCGVVGFAGKSNVSLYLYYSLRALQHRGQESAGIAVFNNKIVVTRGMGLVNEVFSVDSLKKLNSNIGIGHVRYSTAGSSTINNAQPFLIHGSMGDMAIGHNGEISNAQDLKEFLEAQGISFNTESDSEVIIRLLSYNISRIGNIIDGIKKTMSMLIGSYSLVLMINNRLFAIRDPYAIRPLIFGEADGIYGVASESVAFDALNGKIIRDLNPGEILEITENGPISYGNTTEKHTAHCMFEYVYFARADSIIDGKSVYEVRKELGKTLARESPVDADIVVPVPDSGRTHALGYAEESGIPFVEGLMKNRYVDRTFIIPDQMGRIQEIQLKLNPVKEVINNKRIVLVDDSIVRGNTMKKIVNLLKASGAREVHVRIGSPPIVAPCYLGIDMKTRSEFIASGKSIEEIRKIINADSLAYISIDGLIKAIGFPKEDLCLGCLTGIYPVKIKGEKFRDQHSLDSF